MATMTTDIFVGIALGLVLCAPIIILLYQRPRLETVALVDEKAAAALMAAWATLTLPDKRSEQCLDETVSRRIDSAYLARLERVADIVMQWSATYDR